MLRRHLSPECTSFICAMLESDRDERPSAAQLLQHPFITGYQSCSDPCQQHCSSPCSVLPVSSDATSYATPSSCHLEKELELRPAQQQLTEEEQDLDDDSVYRENSRGVEFCQGGAASSAAMSPEGSSLPANSPTSAVSSSSSSSRHSRTLSEQVPSALQAHHADPLSACPLVAL